MKSFIILLSLIFMESCGSSKAAELQNSSQKLSGNYNVAFLESTNVASNKLTLNFDEKTNRVSGFSGCNRYFGSYTVNGNQITFSKIGATKMACLENQDVEQKMLSAFNKISAFEIDKNNLILKAESKTILTASKQIENAKKSTKTQETFTSLDYSAMARGSFTKLTIKDNALIYQFSHHEKPQSIALTKVENEELTTLISSLNLKSLSTLEAPSKAYQYDGAPIGSFSITKDGDTYKVPTFDAGNPNKEIAPVINKVLDIAKKTKR